MQQYKDDVKTIIKKQINDAEKNNGVCFMAMSDKGRYSIFEI